MALPGAGFTLFAALWLAGQAPGRYRMGDVLGLTPDEGALLPRLGFTAEEIEARTVGGPPAMVLGQGHIGASRTASRRDVPPDRILLEC